ncbi:hypothetical protein PUN4_650032 [Paraburkholderia unamae]|nr:hypothetical protein PUN4_650032 [Paraburkholderia unamae]
MPRWRTPSSASLTKPCARFRRERPAFLISIFYSAVSMHHVSIGESGRIFLKAERTSYQKPQLAAQTQPANYVGARVTHRLFLACGKRACGGRSRLSDPRENGRRYSMIKIRTASASCRTHSSGADEKRKSPSLGKRLGDWRSHRSIG